MTSRLTIFLAVAVAALHSIFAIAETRDIEHLNPGMCEEISQTVQESVDDGILSPREAERLLHRCEELYGAYK